MNLSFKVERGPHSAELLAKEDGLLPSASRVDLAVCWKRAQGTHLWDVDGKEYLDFTSGVLVMAAGHSHPQIVAAITEQANTLINCYAAPHPSRSKLADRLLQIAGEPFNRVIFLTTGSEAIDGALKIARYVTGRPGILTFDGAFHGRTFTGISVSGLKEMRKGLGTPLPSIIRAPYPYPYRWEFGEPIPDQAIALAKWAVNMAGEDSIGAILIEPFLGAGGVVPAPARYLSGLRSLADQIGALLIFDEIQSGLGRCGRWFSFHGLGWTPDIVVGSKGLGGGLPIIALLGQSSHFEAIPPGSMTSTFGGNPLSCAAGLATLDVIEKQGLIENAARVSAAMLEVMNSWAGKVPYVGEVRGVGLSFGVELVRDLTTKEPAQEVARWVTRKVWEKGLVILPCAGIYGNVLRFAPALSISQEEALDGLNRLHQTLISAPHEFPLTRTRRQ